METELCRTCGATLKVSLIPRPPFMAQGDPIRNVEKCSACAASLEASNLEAHNAPLRQRYVRESGVPAPRQALSLDPNRSQAIVADADNHEAIVGLRAWVAEAVGGVYLWGPVGTGKSTLAIAALLDCARRTVATPIQFLTEGQVRVAATQYDRTAQAWVRKAWETPILLIDDVGRSDLDGADLRRLQQEYHAILDARLLADLPIILTGEMDPGRLFGWFTQDSTKRRFMSLIQGNAIEMTGPDRSRSKWGGRK